MTWLLCLDFDKLKKLNPSLAKYLSSFTKKSDQELKELPSWLSSRMLGLKYDQAPLELRLAKVIENLPPDQAGNNFGWCESIDEAKLVLDSLLGDPPTERVITTKEACLEKILLRRNTFEVKSYILGEILAKYDIFVQKFDSNRDNLVFFFTAACEGVTDDRELPLLKELAKKFAQSNPGDLDKIDQALIHARKHIKTFAMQRKTVSAGLTTASSD